MPAITIQSLNSGNRLELQRMASEISVETGIAITRIQLTAKYYSLADFLTNGTYAIIHIMASEKNGKDWFQTLMKACTSAAARQFEVEENRIAVIAHPVGEGYLLVNNQFI